jgi:hypothetical protein
MNIIISNLTEKKTEENNYVCEDVYYISQKNVAACLGLEYRNKAKKP